MEYDGYILPPRLVSKFGDAGVDLAKVAVYRPFNRNFIKDKWLEDGREYHFDRRWDGLMDRRVQGEENNIRKAVAEESPEWNSTVPYILYIRNDSFVTYL
jgi:hypothetical protein